LAVSSQPRPVLPAEARREGSNLSALDDPLAATDRQRHAAPRLAPSEVSATPARLLHTVPHAAVRLDASESTVWRLLAEKKLYPTYVRGRTTISEAELQHYVEDSTVRPVTKKISAAKGCRRNRNGTSRLNRRKIKSPAIL
jgi:hypothetical protein